MEEWLQGANHVAGRSLELELGLQVLTAIYRLQSMC